MSKFSEGILNELSLDELEQLRLTTIRENKALLYKAYNLALACGEPITMYARDFYRYVIQRENGDDIRVQASKLDMFWSSTENDWIGYWNITISSGDVILANVRIVFPDSRFEKIDQADYHYLKLSVKDWGTYIEADYKELQRQFSAKKDKIESTRKAEVIAYLS